jgi:hypothetical protein
MKNEININDMEALKIEEKKKEESFNVIKTALEIAFSKGAYSKLEDVGAILNALNNLK